MKSDKEDTNDVRRTPRRVHTPCPLKSEDTNDDNNDNNAVRRTPRRVETVDANDDNEGSNAVRYTPRRVEREDTDDSNNAVRRTPRRVPTPRHNDNNNPVRHTQRRVETETDDDVDHINEGETIVRKIASFLALSDAASVASGVGLDTNPSADGWALGGTHLSPLRWSSSMNTPPTPGLVGISPNPDEAFFQEEDYYDSENSMGHDKRRRTYWAQEKLAAAVFSNLEPLRSYCLDAYMAAKEVQEHNHNRIRSSSSSQSLGDYDESPETLIEPCGGKRRRRPKEDDRILFISAVVDHILNNVPLSVALDILHGIREVSLDTSFAAVRITSMTVQGIVEALFRFITGIWDGIAHFNPLALFKMIVSRPFSAMGKTTEVVVSGIQSVATGVGSASSMAFHRLSAKTHSSSNLLSGHHPQNALRRNRSTPLKTKMDKKLMKKLSSLHSAASVVSYTELADDTGGLSRHAKSRVQRMMHYDVSLRPFVATVKLPKVQDSFAGAAPSRRSNKGSESSAHDSDASSTSSSPLGSPFMCTPQSFPPTPVSRRMVLARGTRFADDVVFLARDQLRVHDALDSQNERTREMAVALTHGKRLAVFDAEDASAGIDLSCGQHVATKAGNMLYCSTRSMVPILRNCFVYFEMTVLPRPGGNQHLIPQASMATLSIGLSTKEMPPNTLVGAWKGSVGLCTTGQMLTAGQWCSPVDPTMSSYGDRATVGCLVCLDDGSAFETWDGVMVTAAVTFNVNERIVSPPVSTLPMGAAGLVGPGATLDPQTPRAPTGGPAPPSFTLPLLVPTEEELYPTVTLHSPGTSVMCRFSAGDVIGTSRNVIGAPPGVTIYAVDGSVILDQLD